MAEKEVGRQMMFKKLANGAYVSEELLDVKYVQEGSNFIQVRLQCDHIHGVEHAGGLEDQSTRTYSIWFGKTKIEIGGSFEMAMAAFDATVLENSQTG